MSGSCYCEPEVASYLASEAWDFATLELGVNMRGEDISVKNFEQRARHFVQTLRKSHPCRPLFLITIFPNLDDFLTPTRPAGLKNKAYREVLRNIHAEADDPYLRLIEGNTLLDRLDALSADFIHPSPSGHIRMGTRLADQMTPLLEQYRLLPCFAEFTQSTDYS
jgi:lysophospholipase L1-like esterase